MCYVMWSAAHLQESTAELAVAGDDRCVQTLTLQVQGQKRWFLSAPQPLQPDVDATREAGRIKAEGEALRDATRACYERKDKRGGVGPCVDAGFVKRLLSPSAGPHGGVFEVVLDPGDLLIFANQLRLLPSRTSSQRPTSI